MKLRGTIFRTNGYSLRPVHIDLCLDAVPPVHVLQIMSPLISLQIKMAASSIDALLYRSVHSADVSTLRTSRLVVRETDFN